MGRGALLLNIINRPIPRFILGIWTFLSVYDLTLAQLLPPDVAQDAPRAWQILMLAEPFLPGWPLWVWLLILAGLFAGMSFEYAFHAVGKRAVPQPPELANPPQLAPQPATPKYALPKQAGDVDIQRVTNKELGAMCVRLAQEIGEMLLQTFRSYSHQEQVALFNKHFATRFFWLYGEARNRGQRDGVLDKYFNEPENLTDVGTLQQRLKSLGNRLPIYYDS